MHVKHSKFKFYHTYIDCNATAIFNITKSTIIHVEYDVQSTYLTYCCGATGRMLSRSLMQVSHTLCA